MDTIALVVTISMIFSGGGALADTKTFTNAYSIQGFATVSACEKAKALEVARMQKLVDATLGKPQVSGQCVSYPAK